MRRLLLFALLATGCSRGGPRAPVPTAMEPAAAVIGATVAVTIRGREFWLATSASFASDRVTVDGRFRARLGATELLEVSYIDTGTLTAVVPGGLAIGEYDLTVIDPGGREGLLPAAFSVVDAVACDLDGDGYVAVACNGDDCDDDPGACGAACNPGAPTDDCDGRDNDCDDEIDEDHVDGPTTCGQGACAGNTGFVTCVGGVSNDTCDPFAGAQTEGPSRDPTCTDDIDNDCDGSADLDDSDCVDLPPIAVAAVSPTVGVAGVTEFVASASGSTDDIDAPAALTYRWDWQGDGSWDDSGVSASHTYADAGTYPVVLEVEDSGGSRAHAEVVVVVVGNGGERIVVTTEVDEGDAGATPSSPGGAGLSLREAIQYANGVGGSPTIEIPSGMSIALDSVLPSPVGVDIVGVGAAVTGKSAIDCISEPQDSWIVGLELYDCVAGVRALTGSGNQLSRLIVHDNTIGVDVGTGNVVGPGNDIYTNVIGVSAAGLVEIVGNRIHDSIGDGIDTGHGILYSEGQSGGRVWKNVVYGNTSGITTGAQGDDVQIAFNTIDGNGVGLSTSGNTDGIDVRNNIFSNQQETAIVGMQQRFAILDWNDYFANAAGPCNACTPGANHRTDDPMFVDLEATDYRLHPSSALIDAGLDIGLDVNGREPAAFNGDGPDMGAYEAP